MRLPFGTFFLYTEPADINREGVGQLVKVKRLFLILTITALFLLNAASYIPSGSAASGQTLYGCAHTGAGTGNPGPSTLYTINPSTGAATAIGLMGFTGCSGLAFASNGVLFAVGNDTSTLKESLFTVNPLTGTATLVGRSDQGSCAFHITDISFRPSDGTLFGYNTGCLGTINTSTGAFTKIGTVNSFPDGNGLSFSPSNVLFYAECCAQGSNKDTLYTLNQNTGVATVVATISTPPACSGQVDPPALAFDGAGILYGAVKCRTPTTAFYLVTIDTSTAALTVIGATVTGLDGLAWTAPPPIPEYPLGLPLLAIFMVIAYGLIRRKTSSNVPG
jgi:hypothetical protein